ncbi:MULTISPECIES: 2OG-Fe(II) oxygenase [Cyanophyceae]|uniref:2OG-Fe(II) oxygenase n=1 Tax=Cyanophyceae TaxID=3028117 RepID=UPI001687DD60|nr:2OG-Fe(II) oxygenase [Trichocoleus sp. FACHB-40]MBD2005604.1 2OG-Fe(II) oxygenase [Trichocoleus sp. FACHB-40]
MLLSPHKQFVSQSNFLDPETHREILEVAIASESKFHSSVNTSAIYPDWRHSKILYHWDFLEHYEKISQEVLKAVPQAARALSLPEFSPRQVEMQMTGHNHGQYFRRHKDNASADTATRCLTFVYYFFSEPQAFSYGELQFCDSGERYCPKNNGIVFFDSGLDHEVLSVTCPSGLWRDSRFTLNGWIRV